MDRQTKLQILNLFVGHKCLLENIDRRTSTWPIPSQDHNNELLR